MNAHSTPGQLPFVKLRETTASVTSAGVSRAAEALLLLLALAAFGIALAPALKESGTPPAWDQANHLRDSLVIERILTHPGWVTPAAVREILRGSEEYPLITPTGYYPPFVPAVTAMLYLTAGRTYETAMATNLLFLGLLCFGVWYLGNRLAARPAGLLGALLVLAAPGIRLNASEYMLDLPLAAMVVVAVGSLLQTRGFSRRGWSVGFGVACGLGMLTKWSFFLFLMAPLAWALSEAWRESASDSGAMPRSRRLANLLVALLTAGLILAPYYAPILPVLARKTWVHAGGAADGFTTPFTLQSALYHLEALPRKLLGWPLTIAMLGGILAAVLQRGPSRRAVLLLLGWALTLYGIFTFAVVNKQSRYLLPWIPVLLLASSLGIVELWRRRSEATRGIAGPVAAGALLLLAAAGLRGGWGAAPDRDWKLTSLAGVLEKDLAARPLVSRTRKLGVVADVQEINGPTIAYFVSRRDLPVTVVQLVNRMKDHVSMEVGLDPFGRPDFYQSFTEYDYLVTKTGKNAVPPWEAVVPRMMEYVDQRKGELVELASFEVPDGSVLSLYRRKDR